MRDEILFRARRLFAELRQALDDCEGARISFLTFYGTDGLEQLERMGMTPRQYSGARELLIHKRLAKPHGMDGLALDDRGYEACFHPGVLNQALGPPRDIEVNVVHVSGQTVVVGDNNSVQVNSDELIQQLADTLQRSSAIEPEQKSRWLEALKDIGAHLASSAVKVVVDRVLT